MQDDRHQVSLPKPIHHKAWVQVETWEDRTQRACTFLYMNGKMLKIVKVQRYFSFKTDTESQLYSPEKSASPDSGSKRSVLKLTDIENQKAVLYRLKSKVTFSLTKDAR